MGRWPSEFRNKVRLSILTSSIKFYTIRPIQYRKEKKSEMKGKIGKKKVKPSLFADNMILNTEKKNSVLPTIRINEFISKIVE